MDLCIYHKNCPDGLAAALAVWLQFPNAEFVTAQYGDSPPDVKNKNVIIVDFSYKREDLLVMNQQAKSLIVIDHHKTAQGALTGLDYCIFDMDKSGAVLTWEYLYPDKEMPLLFSYIQDRDLWQWKMPDSREVSAALRSYQPFFNIWRDFLEDAAIGLLIEEGKAILRYQQQQIEMVLSREPSFVEIGGHTVPCINSTHLISEIGNELAQNHPFAACYFDTTDGKRVFSLRSTDEGVDVSQIAKQYGGGGHRNAAGFTVARPDIL